MILKARAKLNLTLKVLGVRPDGYHDIESVVQSIDLCDRISLKTGSPVPAERGSKETDIKVTCDDTSIPGGRGNLAVDAALALARFAGLKASVEMNIEKGIPVAAGLGGGSADAAAVLIGLNHLWQLGLCPAELMAVGEELGADIPFCIAGGTGIIRGKGERVESLPTPDDLWFIVVTLPEKISTAWAYAKFDELAQTTGAYITDAYDPHAYATDDYAGDACDAAGTYDTDDFNVGGTNVYVTDAYDTSVAATCATSKMIRAMRTGKAQDIAERLSDANDLEPAAISIIPSIADLKQALLAAGSAGVGMSGSGPTVFGLTDSRENAQEILGALERMSKGGKEAFVCQAVPQGVVNA